MKYLKEEQFYIDLYDLITIKECLRVIETFQKIYQQSLKEPEIKEIPEEEKIRGINQMLNRQLFVIKAGKYERKKERIKQKMEADRVKQDKYDTTLAPQGIFCKKCNIPMHSTMKTLWDHMDEPMRVLFFFECTKCKKRKGVFDNGEEWVTKPDICPNCDSEIEIKHSRKGKVITYISNCTNCGYKNKEVEDLKKSHDKYEKEKAKDNMLLDKFRNEFCLSDKEGIEYIETLEKMKLAMLVHDEEVKKYDDTAYQKSMHLRMLSIVDLEKLLTEALERERYIKLSFDKPEIGQYVVVPFTAQDANSSRKNYESTKQLEKIIKESLEETNWRLSSNSIMYRMGYVFGQLKGYEQEDDLLAISGKKKEQKRSSIDPEKMRKYGHDNIVQLGKLVGKHNGIENNRKKRLQFEPNGFYLTDSEGPYTCTICRETTPGNMIWWTPEALRCADCWRNIQEGVIPPLTWDNGNKIWIKDWQIKSEYSVSHSTRKKLEREGLLHGRYLKKQDGTIYCSVYLVAENNEFFKKYPKKPEMNIKFYWSSEHKSFMLNVKKKDHSSESGINE